MQQLNTDMSWKPYSKAATNTVDLSNLPSNTQEIYFAVAYGSNIGLSLVPFIIPYCILIDDYQNFYGGMYNTAQSYICAWLVVSKTQAQIRKINVSGEEKTSGSILYVFYK